MSGKKGGNSGARNLLPPNKPGERRGGRQKGSRNKLSEARVEEELRRIALMDPLALFQRVHGTRRAFTLREIADMDPEVRACIASVKVKTENLTTGDNKQDQTVEIRLWNKVNALELCAKHFGWLTENVAHTGEVAFRWKTKDEP